MVAQGDTFLGGACFHGTDHLWIVINDPQRHKGTALIVNISTLRGGAETTCLLRPGEHPFLKHDSYVRYRSARSARTTDILKALRQGMLMAQPPVNSALLAKIRAAAQASTMLAIELKALL